MPEFLPNGDRKIAITLPDDLRLWIIEWGKERGLPAGMALLQILLERKAEEERTTDA